MAPNLIWEGGGRVGEVLKLDVYVNGSFAGPQYPLSTQVLRMRILDGNELFDSRLWAGGQCPVFFVPTVSWGGLWPRAATGFRVGIPEIPSLAGMRLAFQGVVGRVRRDGSHEMLSTRAIVMTVAIQPSLLRRAEEGREK